MSYMADGMHAYFEWSKSRREQVLTEALKRIERMDHSIICNAATGSVQCCCCHVRIAWLALSRARAMS